MNNYYVKELTLVIYNTICEVRGIINIFADHKEVTEEVNLLKYNSATVEQFIMRMQSYRESYYLRGERLSKENRFFIVDAMTIATNLLNTNKDLIVRLSLQETGKLVLTKIKKSEHYNSYPIELRLPIDEAIIFTCVGFVSKEEKLRYNIIESLKLDLKFTINDTGLYSDKEIDEAANIIISNTTKSDETAKRIYLSSAIASYQLNNSLQGIDRLAYISGINIYKQLEETRTINKSNMTNADLLGYAMDRLKKRNISEATAKQGITDYYRQLTKTKKK